MPQKDEPLACAQSRQSHKGIECLDTVESGTRIWRFTRMYIDFPVNIAWNIVYLYYLLDLENTWFISKKHIYHNYTSLPEDKRMSPDKNQTKTKMARTFGNLKKNNIGKIMFSKKSFWLSWSLNYRSVEGSQAEWLSAYEFQTKTKLNKIWLTWTLGFPHMWWLLYWRKKERYGIT